VLFRQRVQWRQRREVGTAGEGSARGDGGPAVHRVRAAHGGAVRRHRSETARGPRKRRGARWKGQRRGHGPTLGGDPVPETRFVHL